MPIDLAVGDQTIVHTNLLQETSCPASLRPTYQRCYVDYVSNDFY